MRRPRSRPLHRLRAATTLSTTATNSATSSTAPSSSSFSSSLPERLKSRLSRAFAVVQRLVELSRPFWTERGSRRGAWLWTCFTLLLAFATTLYAVSLSFIQKFFWNALNAKDYPNFQKFLAVFVAALVVGPPIITLFEWAKQRTAARWRRFLTERFMTGYFDNKTYYAISSSMVASAGAGAGAADAPSSASRLDNVDQRMSEDIRAFTERAVSFGCTAIVAFFDLLLFSVILYRIHAPLFYMLLAYATFGTSVTLWLGRRLAELNAAQLRREADFRYSLVRVRDNAESIAFYSGERRERVEAGRRFSAAMSNLMRLLGLQRNVTFATTWYRYLVQVVPAVVVSPRYFGGRMPLGGISQAFFSYNHVLNDLSLVVNEFVSLSAFAAATNRLYEFKSELDRKNAEQQQQQQQHEEEGAAAPPPQPGSNGVDGADGRITASVGDGSLPPSQALALRNVSVITPNGERRLVHELSLAVPAGGRMLIVGSSGVGKSSVIRAVAGLWNRGGGTVHRRPVPAHTLFVPQRPYVTLGTLRENLMYPYYHARHTERAHDAMADDETARAALRRVNLAELDTRLGGLDVEADFGSILSHGEQQRLAFARLLLQPEPISLAILDESTSGLDVENERLMYELLRELRVTVVSVGNRPTLIQYHDKVCRLLSDGTWRIEEPEEAARGALST